VHGRVTEGAASRLLWPTTLLSRPASGFVILIALSAFYLGKGEVQARLVEASAKALGERVGGIMHSAISGISAPASGITAAAISMVTLFYGTLRVFVQLQEALDSIWEMGVRSHKTLWERLKDHAVAFLVVLAAGLLLLVSLMASAAAVAVSRLFGVQLSDFGVLWQAGDLLLSFGTLTLVFALIYRTLPSVQIAWRDVLPGAVLSTLLFFVAGVLLSIYLAYGALGSVYGAAGSFLVILAWFYYSAQILLLGAEVTHVYAIRFGSHAQLAAALVSETRSPDPEKPDPAE
jgi:membrane protein